MERRRDDVAHGGRADELVLFMSLIFGIIRLLEGELILSRRTAMGSILWYGFISARYTTAAAGATVDAVIKEEMTRKRASTIIRRVRDVIGKAVTGRKCMSSQSCHSVLAKQ